MNKIKRISTQLLERYGEMFSIDFDKNKEVLNKVAVIRSKGLRNEIAGYITGYMRSAMNSEQETREETESIEEESQ
jgi:small subunit ribosomal protein S17e